MAHEVELTDDGRGLVLSLRGRVGAEEHIEAIRKANAIAEGHDVTYAILDRRGTAASTATLADARTVVRLTAEGPLGRGGARLASLGPPIYPGAERAYRRLIRAAVPGGLEIRSFDDLDAARAWACGDD